MKKVSIIGAGIGGLTAAHELSKNKDYEIHIIERENIVGGQARSLTKSNVSEDKKHSELCWHAVSSGYVHFLQILDEIKDDKGVKVISRLKPLNNFIYAMNNKNVRESNNSFITRISLVNDGFKRLYGFDIPWKDKLFLKHFIFRATTICDERIETYDNITWFDYVKKLTPEVKRWVLDSTAIYLGMDYKKISVAFMMKLVRRNVSSPLLDNGNVFYSFSGPMNRVFLDVWKTQLEKNGVIFHMQSNVINVKTDSKSINEVLFENNETIHSIKTDIVINASGCESLAKWYNGSEKSKYIELAEKGCQTQTQVLYYLKTPVLRYERPTIIIMPDTPWFLMTRVENTLWKTPYDLLSAGIGIWDTPGVLYNKIALECTREELAKECWHQMQTSQHNLILEENMPEWDIWFSFIYDEKSKQIHTYEPKWSNNIGTMALRPKTRDNEITNLFHATAYTRTDMDVYNMESAAEAGVKAAIAIQNINGVEELKTHRTNDNHFMGFCRLIDNFFFKIFRCFRQ